MVERRIDVMVPTMVDGLYIKERVSVDGGDLKDLKRFPDGSYVIGIGRAYIPGRSKKQKHE